MSKRMAGSTRHFLPVILLIALLAWALVASAQEGGHGQGVAGGATTSGTIYVDWEATGANDGSSWANAFTDLQAGLDAAAPDDEIWVAAGTYYPSLEHGGTGDRYKSFQMLNEVAVYGGFDPSAGDVDWEDRDWANNVTILSGDIGVPGDKADNCYHVFYHPDGTGLEETALLDGFTVSGGNADGSGVHASGGGMYNYDSSPTVSNCTFSGNSAGNGGGMYNFSNSPTLTNCTFSGNSADNGGGMRNYESSPTLTNCTFSGNSAGNGGGMWIGYGSEPRLTNCILWGDTPDEIWAGSTIAVTYSDIQGGYLGEGNINADPLFVDSGSGDFHLQPCSPAIDAGDNDAANLLPYDFEGDDRIFNGAVDMGVDETDFPPPTTYDLTVTSTEGGSVTVPGEGTFPYGCGRVALLVATPEAGYRLVNWTGDPVADPNEPSTTITMDANKSVTANFIFAVIYVDLDATGANDGSSWGDAFTDLQAGLDAAAPGDEIWVAAGTYYPSLEHGGTGDRYKSFQMLNEVAIYGGFDPTFDDVDWEDRDWANNVTILSGNIGVPGDDADNSYHVFYHPDGTDLDETALLDGFTISGGNADGSDDHVSGGGMFNYDSSPTVSNCRFEGNMADSGGGMYSRGYGSAPTLANCRFEGNSASDGGGMYNGSYSSPTLTDCTFEGNSASEDGGGMYSQSNSWPTLSNCIFEGNWASDDGGGMYNYGPTTLSNCTFSGNSASDQGGGMYNRSANSLTLSDSTIEGNSANEGGGMYNYWSSPTLSNCTFSGNSASYGGGMRNYESSPTLTNCTFFSNSAGNGGGMYSSFDSLPTLTNCTFSGNSADEGGGMYNDFDSSPTLTGCILWGDTPDEISAGTTIAVTYSDIQGGYLGEGNIDADPLFVDSGSGDVHLQPCSPAIDAGDNDAANLPPYDFEGDDRIFNGTVDMGVDETDFPPPMTYDLTVTSTEGGSVTVPGEGTFPYGCGRVAFLVATQDAGYRFVSWTGDPVADPNEPSTIITMDANKSVTANFIPALDAIFVDIDATGANDGTSWEDAYSNLQEALTVAQPGDEIWVAAGTYYPSLEHGGTGDRYKSFQMLNEVAIYGGFDPTFDDVDWEDRDWADNVTILSGDIGAPGDNADNCYHVFYHPDGTGLEETALLDGFTISGGNATYDDGGGMYNYDSSPTVSNCRFEGNSASYGGGMCNREFSSPTLTNCTFEGNSASYTGGGMYNYESSPTLTDCTFEGNSADDGGGMHNRWSTMPMLTNCTFKGNSAVGTLGGGGGMLNTVSSPTLTNCTFEGNSASYNGGGMYNSASSPTLTNCTFSGSSASWLGGGMYSQSNSSPTLTNCTFEGNSASYRGGGVYSSDSSVTLTNCILWGDTPDEVYGGSLDLTYCDIQGGHLGEGNIDADPLWVDPDTGDYHLSEESPCIDAGTNDAPDLPAYDFEGDDRIIDGDGGGAVVDMGVDEALAAEYSYLYLPLVLRNTP